MSYGAFFTTEAPLPANYPQIGIGKNADGSDSGTEGATPSAGDSITRYFADDEMCALEQFKDIPNCVEVVAPDGLAHSMAILEGNAEFSNNISDAEVDSMVNS
ncbi:hypothetical protein [Shewanella surugensis]|uniref:Uncharacterized protein n=1 Tax=Shewanella surugensis TaxID=212020 RepID=A0ABT0LI15_9GAMM|nr:hypothetical protein [Shewanella surugensis]MCL1127352.1 hypothetical protein [Shewanella surugensis]